MTTICKVLGWARRSVPMFYLAAITWFLPWRLWQVGGLTGSSRALSCASLTFEMLILVSSFRGLLLLFSDTGDLRAVGHEQRLGDYGPWVDILITTVDEPTSLLERTVLFATSQQHPNCRVWLLDDGARPEVEALAEQLGVRWIPRKVRTGGKAGNLNNGLSMVRSLMPRSDFVAVFDADFLAMPEFVTRTLPFMRDPGIALVQTPQFFYNSDLFQRALGNQWGLPDCLRFIFDVVQPRLAGHGSGNCCGTSFLVRASALSVIGGFAEDALTEDLVTGFRLRAAGYKIVYLNEFLSAGRATETYEAFAIQRSRWTRGFLQLAKANLRLRGASWFRRLLGAEAWVRGTYLPICGWWLVVLPIWFWWLGLSIFVGGSTEIAVHVAPLLLFHRVSLFAISGGRYLPVYSDAILLLQGFTTVPAAVQEVFGFGRRRRFDVTPKTSRSWERDVDWVPFTGAVVVLLALSAGMGGAATGALRGAHQPGRIAYAIWTVVAAVTCWLSVLFAMGVPQSRAEPRFAFRPGLPVTLWRHRMPIAAAVLIEATFTHVVLDIRDDGFFVDVELDINGVGLEFARVAPLRRTSRGAWVFSLIGLEGEARGRWYTQVLVEYARSLRVAPMVRVGGLARGVASRLWRDVSDGCRFVTSSRAARSRTVPATSRVRGRIAQEAGRRKT